MIIRKGTQNDMPFVLDLIKELAIFEKEPDAVVVTIDDLIRDGFGDQPLFYTFIAEVGNEIVGMALYYYRYSTWKGKTIHLEDLLHRGCTFVPTRPFLRLPDYIRQPNSKSLSQASVTGLD